MKARALQRGRGNEVILAAACIALVFGFTSCGGGGSMEVTFTSNAGFSLSATAISFANQSAGSTSTPLIATVTNVGDATLTFSKIQVTGPNAGDFSLTNNCGSSLAASAQCSLAVTFAPSAAGTRTAAVVFSDNASGSPQTLSLAGTGAAPGVGLSATILTFGSQLVGTGSPAQTLTLTNNGNSALGITGLAVTGSNPGDFPETTNCGSSVAAGGSCTISVTFTPAALGSRSAALTITDNASGSPQAVSLTGTGSDPVVSLTANSLAFGSQNLGTTSAPQSVTLNNTGSAALSISGIALSGANPGDFAETATCGASVAAGGNCAITVTFTPGSAGTRTASVTIADNASDSSQIISLTGTGVGTAAAASLSPSSLAFGSQPVTTTSAPLTVTLNNTGKSTLNIASFGFSGANASDFAQSATTCGSALAASASCSISITFGPAAAGGRSATLVVKDDSGNIAGSTQNVSLTGTGAAAAVGLSASTLTFASQAVGTTSAAQAVILTDTGNGPLAITSISVTGANVNDFAQTNTCGSAVAVGGSCSIAVTFTPSASGTRTASVSIADNASGSPQTVSLTGAGTSGGVGLSATALTFGNQAVSTTSTAQVLTLTNGGSSTVTINSIQVTGANSGDFGQSNNCASSVAANGSCKINVTFAPTASGSRTATLSVNDNASGSPQTASLTGTGTAPVAGLSPSSFAFADQPAATSSSAQIFTLSNTGNATLDIAGIGFAGANASDFSEIAACGTTLTANSSCTIAVVFTPATSGSRSASLTVTDNSNAASGSTQSSTLTGSGSHDVILSWAASQSSGVVGYNVYRGTVPGGESSTPLNSTPINGTSYVDADVTPGMAYYYEVTAVGANGTQSSASNETEALP